ncbi:hypothetical protein RF679_03400 [Undibacterium cyanobacteriorum]|uniref:4a-hydroxytetrahydrobiopterin dehydratase n=1 Tax=Undibacterium cyanobacteriorum TaxID=3073561 RepID=A0ABY9RJC5_9BURK|nr:hypothetical protein [Undibacterium sp. 20NA77.5]WMW81336.1 hypothetical protein RF679_03400 [Undibacterium sp. 20NA77.5]
MFRVYWTEHHNDTPQARFRDFDTREMQAALHFIEALRQGQRHGLALQHITMSSQNPHSVGLAGVAEPAADYEWKKRRA